MACFRTACLAIQKYMFGYAMPSSAHPIHFFQKIFPPVRLFYFFFRKNTYFPVASVFKAFPISKIIFFVSPCALKTRTFLSFSVPHTTSTKSSSSSLLLCFLPLHVVFHFHFYFLL